MTIDRGGSAKHTISRLRDGEAVSFVENVAFNSKLIEPELHAGDNYPNIDGYLTLLDSEGRPIGKIQAQVKTLQKIGPSGKISHHLKDPFLSYCKDPQQMPIIFVGVDLENDVAYWVEMRKSLVDQMQGNTIHLDPNQTISKENHKYYDYLLARAQEFQRAIQEKEERDQQEPEGVDKKPDQDLIKKTTENLKKLFIDLELKYKYYYPFINLLEPFYLDDRGVTNREKLRTIFEINATQEKEFIKRMQKEKIIKIVGGLCIVTDDQKVTDLQNDMLNSGTITLDNILRLFQ